MGGGEAEEERIKRKRGNEKSPLSQEESSAWSRVSSGFPGVGEAVTQATEC